MARSYNQDTKNILLSLAVCGAFVIASSSPFFLVNVARAIIKNRKYIGRKIRKKIDEKKIARALERLRKNRLVILSEKNGEFKVELSRKGKREVEKIKFKDMKIKKPKVWDRKWRIVIFDIPDKNKKRARDALREKLQELNFYPLQKSVWVCPFPCEKEIQFLCELFDIFSFVNIIIADKVYDDIKLRKYFRLL